MIKTFQNSLTKTIFKKTTCFVYFFVILQRMIYKKIMTVSRQFPLIHVKKIIRFRGTKMFNRWYTHSIGLKHLQSETLPQKPQSLISCWKPCSAPKFLLCSAVSTVAHKDKHFPDSKTLPIQKHFRARVSPALLSLRKNGGLLVVYCSFEWHLTPDMTLSIETYIRRTSCIKRTLQHSPRVSA